MANQTIIAFALVVMTFATARADDTSSTTVSPYIDNQKSKLPAEKQVENPVRTESNPDPYIQAVKAKLNQNGAQATDNPLDTQQAQPYIDQLKASHPEEFKDKTDGSYTSDQQAKLGPDKTSGAIDAVNENRSELKLKRPGDVRGAFGVTVGTAIQHNYTGSSQYVAQPFANPYGSSWVPDISLFAEYKFLRMGTIGNLSVFGTGEFTVNKGYGTYEIPLYQGDGTPFGQQDKLVQLTFIAVPVTAGLKYDFALGRYLQPFASFGPTLIGMSESRSDGNPTHHILSKGFTLDAGLDVQLDWIFGENSWNLYQDVGIKHLYLTIQYTKLTTVSSPVDASYSGVAAGFTFEF